MMQIALRRVARLVNGGTPSGDSENWGGDVPWATPVDLATVDGAALTGTHRSLTLAGLRSGSATVPPSSLLLSTRAPIGYMARTTVVTAFNQGCRGIVPRADVDVRFLLYALMSSRSSLIAAGTGSTFQELSSEALASTNVPLHALPQQRHIADFLDDQVARLDALTLETQKAVGKASGRRDATVQSLLLQDGRLLGKPPWFTDIPRDWACCRCVRVGQ
jgi:type I restriction enzyme S subunit